MIDRDLSVPFGIKLGRLCKRGITVSAKNNYMLSRGYKEDERVEINQGLLAELLNCGQCKISKLMHGDQEPSLRDLVTISQIFNVSTDYLLGLSDSPYPILDYSTRVIDRRFAELHDCDKEMMNKIYDIINGYDESNDELDYELERYKERNL